MGAFFALRVRFVAKYGSPAQRFGYVGTLIPSPTLAILIRHIARRFARGIPCSRITLVSNRALIRLGLAFLVSHFSNFFWIVDKWGLAPADPKDCWVRPWIVGVCKLHAHDFRLSATSQVRCNEGGGEKGTSPTAANTANGTGRSASG